MLKDSTYPSKAFVRIVWLLIAIMGLASWMSLIVIGDAARGWRALLAAFAFFTPISAALVCWSAIFLRCEAKWVWPWVGCAEAGVSFALPSLVTLIALWIFHDRWAPWGKAEFQQGFWLNVHFLFGRDLAALALFWLLAYAYVKQRRKGGGERLAVWLILAFGWVFSLIAFDLIGALDPLWYSSLFGGYFFISALYGAITIWTFVLLARDSLPKKDMRDFAGLIVAFSLLTTAMMYSQLLPIWYANIEHEVRFLIPRWNYLPWSAVSVIFLFTIYLGPLILLLTRWMRTTRWYLVTISLLLLVLLWVERLWLITPVFRPDRLDIGPLELSIMTAFVGVFGFIMAAVDVTHGTDRAAKGSTL